ncbi:hypothetical protein [Methylobacterium gnaphalii]|uniref:Uncharacterized protein n=1 Tax=Methylobacterium gnaphalii TaxID=1010610 RepID=A0A512JQF3_9HYPH|nr:hypothetical protein [Methylobacterium gnaphalii]GEP12161.1 hypothetical protein MGN01_40060 [Methylobacterium gnaphalii]GJD70026.1 hypothetical protein MMMDOFMJ_2966 [Methylobacterium gnaphalii]GLS48920.1 hypothetical protein GCM10007885_17670 [Methylobacterium gnaphalii]
MVVDGLPLAQCFGLAPGDLLERASFAPVLFEVPEALVPDVAEPLAFGPGD